ncbi:MAG: hypothetical protein JWO36_3990 [Myxococcales bacterium]|nr:hypothetical protein [Myxococcales bacterium]
MESSEPIVPAVQADTRRWPYLAAVAAAGASVALLAYRFGVLPFLWRSKLSFVFPGFSAGLGVAAGTILRDLKPRRWPPLPLVIGAALAGAAVAAGLAFAFAPPLSRVVLSTRSFPGFSIDLPRGETKEKPASYTAGSVHVLDVGGTGGVAGVDWEPGGRLDPDQLQMLGRALSGSNNPGKLVVGDLAGVKVDTLTISTDKTEIIMTVVPCGTRHLIVMTAGDGTETLHARMLATVRCTPDAALEAGAAQIGVELDLPGWYVAAKEGIQLQLTDGTSALIVQPGGATAGPLRELLEKGFGAAMGGSIRVGEVRPDGLISFDLTIEKEHVVGLAQQVMCPGNSTLLMLMTPDQASLDRWSSKITAPRCLRPGEPAQHWPDPPTK